MSPRAPRISAYSFGRIVVDGAVHTADLIVLPGGVVPSWWRKEGHRLAPEDLAGVLETPPDILVVGTGALGVMRVPEETLADLQGRGVEVHVARTGRAVELFDALAAAHPGKRVIGAFHLTC